MSEIKITTEIVFTDQRIEDLLCCALEGGSNDWYEIVDYTYPPSTTRKDYEHPYLNVPLKENGAVKFRTLDNDQINGAKSWSLDRAAIARGLKIMHDKYPRHFTDVVSENEDATTGDVFLQCCLFGEIVFG